MEIGSVQLVAGELQWAYVKRLTRPGSEQFNTIHEWEVRNCDEGTKDDGGEQDNDRRVTQLRLSRPRGLFEFGHRLFIKETDTCEWIFH